MRRVGLSILLAMAVGARASAVMAAVDSAADKAVRLTREPHPVESQLRSLLQNKPLPREFSNWTILYYQRHSQIPAASAAQIRRLMVNALTGRDAADQEALLNALDVSWDGAPTEDISTALPTLLNQALRVTSETPHQALDHVQYLLSNAPAGERFRFHESFFQLFDAIDALYLEQLKTFPKFLDKKSQEQAHEMVFLLATRLDQEKRFFPWSWESFRKSPQRKKLLLQSLRLYDGLDLTVKAWTSPTYYFNQTPASTLAADLRSLFGGGGLDLTEVEAQKLYFSPTYEGLISDSAGAADFAFHPSLLRLYRDGLRQGLLNTEKRGQILRLLRTGGARAVSALPEVLALATPDGGTLQSEATALIPWLQPKAGILTADARQIEALFQDLDSDEYPPRQAAAQRLLEGDEATRALILKLLEGREARSGEQAAAFGVLKMNLVDDSSFGTEVPSEVQFSGVASR